MGKRAKPQTPAQARKTEAAKLARGGYIGRHRKPDPLAPKAKAKGKPGLDDSGDDFAGWWG